MQHWTIYCSWNEKLFEEMYKAYLAGHLEKDPSKGWYEGELGFFDFYVIPLAEKLGECNVFGVSGTEYLSYAVENRNEWEQKGLAIVQGYVRKYRPVKDHCFDDLGDATMPQKIGACRDLQNKDDALSVASGNSNRAARSVDGLFNYSYHRRSDA